MFGSASDSVKKIEYFYDFLEQKRIDFPLRFSIISIMLKKKLDTPEISQNFLLIIGILIFVILNKY